MIVDSFLDALNETSRYSLAVNIPYAIAFAAVASEVVWIAWTNGAARRKILTSAATASVMAGGALVLSVAYTGALTFLWHRVARFRIEALADFWQSYFLLGVVVTFVAWDFSGWIYHLIGHRTRVGWAAHQPHHSGESFDATLGFRQSWAPFHGLLHHPFLALLGFDIRVVIVCAAISNCWQVLEHTSVPIRFPRWFAAVVITPGAHRHHHGTDGGLVNVGPFFTVWDRLAGTWRPESAPAPRRYGPVRPASVNPFVVEFAGWGRLLRTTFGSRTPPATVTRPDPSPSVHAST